MNSKGYTRLSLKERHLIDGYISIGMSISQIANKLNRQRSTIYREIKRARDLPGTCYAADQAHIHAVFRNRVKRIDNKLRVNTALRTYVFRNLILGNSPDQIANRIALDYPLNPHMRVSYESIYRFIYYDVDPNLGKRLIKLLPYKKPKRIKGNRRQIYMGTIIDRTSIDERPKHIETRKEIGHWEGDLIVGKGQTSVVGTLVERATRYTIIVPLISRKSKYVATQFANALLQMPEKLRKSLTYDNGVEMSAHKLFTKYTEMPVYFAHPYSSWERGTNENTNGLIRRVYPKKTNFNRVPHVKLKELEENLNNRPRKVLKYRTPLETLMLLCA